MFKLTTFFQLRQKTSYRSIISGCKNMTETDYRELNEIRKKLLNVNLKIPKINFLNFFVKNEYLTEITSQKLKEIFYKDVSLFPVYGQEIIKSHANPKYRRSLKLSCPKNFLKFLEKNNFKVNYFYSLILWYLQILVNFFLGIFLAIKILFLNISKLNKKNNKNFIFFEYKISNEELSKIKNQSNFFFFNKIINYFSIKNSEIIFNKSFSFNSNNEKKICTVQTNLVFTKHTHLPYFDNFFQLINFFLWIIFTSFFIIFLLLIGKWSYCLIFREIVEEKVHRLTSYNYIPKLHFKHYEGGLVKPLWIYYAEKKEMKSYMFFYSTNDDGYPTKIYIPEDETNKSQFIWKNYLVWNSYQAEKLFKVNKNIQNIHILGPMLLHTQSSEKGYYTQNKSFISIFDITPKRKIKECMDGYYTIINSEIMKQFIIDIIDIAEKHNIQILHKPKRDLNKLSKGNSLNKENKSFNEFIRKMNNRKYFDTIPAEADLNNLLKSSLATISFPYTSVAIMSKELQKESIFYDPSSKLIKDNFFTHNLDLISGRQELDIWFSKISKR